MWQLCRTATAATPRNKGRAARRQTHELKPGTRLANVGKFNEAVNQVLRQMLHASEKFPDKAVEGKLWAWTKVGNGFNHVEVMSIKWASKVRSVAPAAVGVIPGILEDISRTQRSHQNGNSRQMQMYFDFKDKGPLLNTPVGVVPNAYYSPTL